MDKYEYKLKTEEMLELMEDGEYRKAAAAADLIDQRSMNGCTRILNQTIGGAPSGEFDPHEWGHPDKR